MKKTLPLKLVGSRVNIERVGGAAFGRVPKDTWDVELSPETNFDMNLDYGAAEMNLDLENIKVNRLEIDSGAATTNLKFGSYPTRATMKTGASTVNMKFPKDIGVMVEVEGGAVSSNFNDFIKKDKTYYSENYDEREDNIEVSINAGASSIKGEFY